jgi:hypothetical protein
MLGALVVQWMRQSDREARRIDRALDRAEALEAARAEAGANPVQASGYDLPQPRNNGSLTA